MAPTALTLPLPTAAQALPGRSTPMPRPDRHAALGSPLAALPEDHPLLADLEPATFGLGCFWGAERLFWQTPGVISTAVGYAGGLTPHPTYDEVCSGLTGHAEVVRVLFDPAVVSYAALLRRFWEAHNPTQGMRQGNDIGTQYRSCIHTHGAAQQTEAEASRAAYDAALTAAGRGPITTEVMPAPAFYFAEGYHQQYLHKNPNGYCGLRGTGVPCPAAGD